MEIKDVRLPVALQRAMAAEAEATREARAKVSKLKQILMPFSLISNLNLLVFILTIFLNDIHAFIHSILSKISVEMPMHRYVT